MDFPIAVVSRRLAREKSSGTAIRARSMWWARRRLAACRPTLLALLLPTVRPELSPKISKNRRAELLPRANRLAEKLLQLPIADKDESPSLNLALR
ncbi:DUF1156 domain-containing protein [Candidatus Binatus sp.]|uniref:DUF1156 domain-containing protein n=1 Tax=Candidatus Binatus sp. TaxID=2811406 RepID=UPI00351DA0E7